MPTIDIRIKDKIAMRTGGEAFIVRDNSDYVINFTFDVEWAEETAKTARFALQRGGYMDVPFTGSSVAVPVISTGRRVDVGVFAGNLRTTTSATLPLVPSIRSKGGAPVPPEDAVYDKLIALINSMGEISDDDIKQAVEDYLSANPIAAASMRVDSGYIQYSNDNGKTWVNLIAEADLKGDKGADGKSAYQYAQDGGYTGTEAEFATKLASEIPAVDSTLTQSGKAADAKAVGDALAGKQNTISDLEAIRTGAAKGATALQSVPSTYRTASEQDTIDDGKVDKVTGKGLSSNDYTDAAKAKVDALAPVATSGSYNDLTNKPTIPTALPNPNALTFTGAVIGSYDGSESLTVEIPSGGGGSDISLGLTGATVGQIAKITAVDDTGKPTAWEAVDMPSGGDGSAETFELIKYIKTTEAVNEIRINADDIGEPFELKELQIYTQLYLQDDTYAPIAIRLHSSVNGSTTNYNWSFITTSPNIKSDTALQYPAVCAGHFKPKDYTIDNKKYWVADTWSGSTVGVPSTAGDVKRVDFLKTGEYETHVMDAVRCVMINAKNGTAQIGANSEIWIFGKRGKVT